MSYTFRPLIWTGPRTPTYKRKSRWTFRANYSETLQLLKRELDMINASQIVIEADYAERDIRRDGLPRADARKPQFPGIRLSFNMPGVGRVQYETDVFETWEANLRAITLGLEALRKVERYGITAGKQQYTGFRAIGGNGTPMPAGKMDREDAAHFIAKHSTVEPYTLTLIRGLKTDSELLARMYRIAAKKLHPDQGGDAELFKRLQEAKEVLDID